MCGVHAWMHVWYFFISILYLILSLFPSVKALNADLVWSQNHFRAIKNHSLASLSSSLTDLASRRKCIHALNKKTLTSVHASNHTWISKSTWFDTAASEGMTNQLPDTQVHEVFLFFSISNVCQYWFLPPPLCPIVGVSALKKSLGTCQLRVGAEPEHFWSEGSRTCRVGKCWAVVWPRQRGWDAPAALGTPQFWRLVQYSEAATWVLPAHPSCTVCLSNLQSCNYPTPPTQAVPSMRHCNKLYTSVQQPLFSF